MNFLGMPLTEEDIRPGALRRVKVRTLAQVLVASDDASRAGYAKGRAEEACAARYRTLAWCFAVSALTHFLTRMA